MTIAKQMYEILTSRKLIKTCVRGYIFYYHPYIGYTYKLFEYIIQLK